MTIKEPEFKIGQKVYHITPESEAGIIIEITYYLSEGIYKYCVGRGWENECWCFERELSEHKIY